MSKFISKQSVAIWYALTASLLLFQQGKLSYGFSQMEGVWEALCFSIVLGETKSLGEFFKQTFLQQESTKTWSLTLLVPAIYYGVSILLMNVSFTGNSLLAFFLYFPWTFLYGGLEEVGWRWFLQDHLYFSKNFITKMMVLSLVWFLWHIPIYQLPWITAGSSNYLIFT